MEDLAPLTVVCRHLKNETREAAYTRLRRSKRAAQVQNCRLRAKLRRAEQDNQFLLDSYLTVTAHLQELHERVALHVQEDSPRSDG